jgi:hypothetical protein
VKALHYWRRRLEAKEPARLVAAACEAVETLSMLSEEPRPRLSWLVRFLSLLTTPFKRLGISGWSETGCDGRGTGSPVRDAQYSTDGFWTIDVALSDFKIGARRADLSSPLFLRLEIEPGTRAHAVCEARDVREGDVVTFAGAIVIDRDADFLEIHPDADFAVASRRTQS